MTIETHKTSVDEKLDEILVHTWLSEAFRVEEETGRTQEMEKDEQEFITEARKAFYIDDQELAEYSKSYAELQNLQEEGVLATAQGNRTLSGNRANKQFYKAVSLTHLVNLLMSKDDLGLVDDLAARGIDYAAEHKIAIPETEVTIARRVGAIGMIEAADLGALFGWPTDDRNYGEGITPQGRFLAHFNKIQPMIDEKITLGILEYSDESPQAQVFVDRWLRLSVQKDASKLDDRAKNTYGFVRDHLPELLVATMGGIGYDPDNPPAFENHKRLYCKKKPILGHPKNPEIKVELVDDISKSCVLDNKGKTIIKAVPNAGTNTCTVYHKGNENTFTPIVVDAKMIGTTVDDFIEQNTPKAQQRERQLYDGMVQIVNGGHLPEELKGSYEVETLYRLRGAFEIAMASDAEGQAFDPKGKVSGNEIALMREALEFAGYSSRTSDLLMGIRRDRDNHISEASFGGLAKVYQSEEYHEWAKSKEAKTWLKQYRPYTPKRSLFSRVRSTMSMKAISE